MRWLVFVVLEVFEINNYFSKQISYWNKYFSRKIKALVNVKIKTTLILEKCNQIALL